MKQMKQIFTAYLAIMLLVGTSGITVSRAYGLEADEGAYGTSSEVFNTLIQSAQDIDNLAVPTNTSEPQTDDYSDLIARYENASERDPVSAILERWPVSDSDLINVISSWDDQTVINTVAGELDENLILGILIARSPRLSRAINAWQASLERYPQTAFLQDILAGYQSMTEGMSLGIGKEYQTGMIQMNYPGPGMMSLRGDVVERDIDSAWSDYIKEAGDIITDARNLLSEIRFRDEMISINSAGVNRLATLTAVVEAQYISGTRSFSDLVRIRSELATRRDTVDRITSMRASLLGQLASMLNLPPNMQFGTFSWPDDQNLDMNIETLIADMEFSSPELLKIGFGIEKMDAMIAMTTLRADPDQTFGFTYFQGRDVQALSETLSDENMSGMDMDGGGSDTDMDMGSMNFMNQPMIDYRNYNYPLDLAWAAELVERRDAMSDMLDAKTDMLSGMLNMQVEKYLQAIDSSGVSSGQIIPNSQAALDVVRTGYTSDENNFNDLIMAELSLLMARMDLAGYERDMRVALSEIARILGHDVDVEFSSEPGLEYSS